MNIFTSFVLISLFITIPSWSMTSEDGDDDEIEITFIEPEWRTRLIDGMEFEFLEYPDLSNPPDEQDKTNPTKIGLL